MRFRAIYCFIVLSAAPRFSVYYYRVIIGTEEAAGTVIIGNEYIGALQGAVSSLDRQIDLSKMTFFLVGPTIRRIRLLLGTTFVFLHLKLVEVVA